jgi:hypothetical protein
MQVIELFTIKLFAFDGSSFQDEYKYKRNDEVVSL